jgi:hypothetical protein
VSSVERKRSYWLTERPFVQSATTSKNNKSSGKSFRKNSREKIHPRATSRVGNPPWAVPRPCSGPVAGPVNARLQAVERAFRGDVDYAQLVKVYNETSEGQKRYSPAECVGCTKNVVVGFPDPEHVSTSYIERANLTMRMGMRRFTRLTNAFSKKIENHAAAVALHMMHYNFVRIHTTLRTSPAMAAGVTGKLWEIADIVALLDQENSN